MQQQQVKLLLFALLTGFIWGFAEGTFFFIVPDVLLCFWALSSWRAALYSTIAVVLGAFAAAILLFALLNTNPQLYADILLFWQKLPGFKIKMLDVVSEHLRAAGAKGLILGPTSGIPYRIYVLEAWQQKISLSSLLVWTPIARLERLIIAPLAVLVLNYGARALLVERWKKISANTLKISLAILIIVYWIALYYWYWGIFLPKTYS